ncbi:hypothetical protein [Kitasatospora sp. NPDC050543]|uniref:hypothetical protein n=1 Tax=Kitasatospora sp. NPDC050543 TaxID=3364054 RepID=UPI0037A94850
MEQTAMLVSVLESVMVYETPVPGQPQLLYELVMTHPVGMGELEHMVVLAASCCGAACACAVAAVIMPSNNNTTVTRFGMWFRKVFNASLKSSRRSTTTLMQLR